MWREELVSILIEIPEPVLQEDHWGTILKNHFRFRFGIKIIWFIQVYQMFTNTSRGSNKVLDTTVGSSMGSRWRVLIPSWVELLPFNFTIKPWPSVSFFNGFAPKMKKIHCHRELKTNPFEKSVHQLWQIKLEIRHQIIFEDKTWSLVFNKNWKSKSLHQSISLI